MKKLTLTIIALGLTITAFAADTQKGVLVIDKFTTGLKQKQSEFSLSPSDATVANNVRLNSPYGSISKRDNLRVYGSADAIEPITGLFRHYLFSGDKVLLAFHGDEMEKGADSTGTFTNILNLTTGDHRFSCVSWHNLAICSDGYNQPIKYDGSSASATYLGSLLATNAGSGSGPATGTYTYKVGCYSTTYTVLLNTPSNSFTANGNDMSLSMIPVCGDTTLNGEATTGRKIYRTGSNDSSYKLLSNGTIANNTATTLTDSDADGALGAAMPAGDATWTPPKGKYVLVQNNRLFFANDPTNSPSRVWYSADGLQDIFDASNVTGYLDIRQNDGDSITFMKGNLGLLTIGKNNTIQKIYIDGGDPDADWSISDPLSYVGCQAPYSAVNSPLGILYLAKEGIYRFNGQYSELISESVTPTIEDIAQTDLENVAGIYHNNFYHMAYKSEASGESFNNRVLVLDILAKAYTIDLLNINSFTTFNSGNDFGVLYSGASDSGNVYAYSNEINEVVHKRHSDFTGLWDDMRYIPTAVGGDSESPVLEIARTETIDELTGTINNLVGVIDRQDVAGNYVSQPLTVGALSLDKLYWNEVTPGSGTVTFKIRTSPTGERNLLHNDDFEFWDNWATGTPNREQPNDWTFSTTAAEAGAGATQSTTQVQRGTYSAKLTKPSTGVTTIARSISNASNYAGHEMVFKGYIKSANSVASKVWLEISENSGAKVTRAYYNNGGGWEATGPTTTISATTTSITAKCSIDSDANAVAYFDQVMMIEGSTAQNDWSAWSSAFTNSSGSDISAVTANTYLQYLINLTTSDITVTPKIVKASGYDVHLTYNKEGTSQSSDIPVTWESGWIDMGQPSLPKVLRTLEVYHTGTSGTLTVTLENFLGDTDTFSINLSSNPSRYKQAFTDGALVGKLFKLKISNTGVLPLEISKVIIGYEVNPDNGDFT